ncbi:MAG: hypothetical protein RMK65_04985 [Anaerolineae bacterium]|nr:hypothetical protein [Anaerolineae bacterium]MCX8068655.1 hypothetical protein [Anaerolineae bacterium]MDW7991491.1 hypothetical protein [Anaerolineae bacterium]
MTQNRERLAWIILLVSFALCIAIAVGTPLGIRQFLLTSTRRQAILLQPQKGTLSLQRGGQGDFLALRDPTWDVPERSVVMTDGAAQALLTFQAPGRNSETVATAQLYGDTRLAVSAARSPRFGMSPLPHRVTLRVEAGRVRITVLPTNRRESEALLRTPHLTALLKAGSYEVRVYSALTEFIVREGQARVTDIGGHTLSLKSAQRTIAQFGNVVPQVLPAARNLLVNGDFRQPLSVGWETYVVEAGTVQTSTVAGRPAAWFFRDGVGHAEVGIRQTLNYDVRDFTSLVLHLSVMIRGQSLPGCGMAGSECPIIVKVEYQDIFGGNRTWYHGFYSVPKAATDYLYVWSDQIPLSTWVSYDSENLMELDPPPALIQSVTIYASGHSFDALVTEVELLAQE